MYEAEAVNGLSRVDVDDPEEFISLHHSVSVFADNRKWRTFVDEFL